ncbi:sortase domain-containing protein [Streptomyces sp. NBC_00304]|uniref:sortase domain-containing protein n=1 Tax=Streptomyces sp. NBC_00304 TaxID=2975706 RepID=UPI002E2A4861|nr:sortase [Streptomyces sp. NBC_00304]
MREAPAPGTGRRGIWTAAAALCVLGGALAVGAAVHQQAGPPPRPRTVVSVSPPSPAGRATAPQAGMTRSVPTAVRIPAVGLKATLVPEELDADGQLPLPRGKGLASWVGSSATPGERGTSVLAGHVDTSSGPAAFYNLGAAKPGMDVAVARRDGTTARFTVDAVAVYPKNEFPDTTVYGPTPGPSLRLLTCTGWDPDARAYRENVVVYATPRHDSAPK